MTIEIHLKVKATCQDSALIACLRKKSETVFKEIILAGLKRNPMPVNRRIAIVCNPTAGKGKAKPVQLKYEGRQQVKDVFMISIANGSRYGGGFLVAPQADPTDGDLDMVLIRRIHPLLRFFHLPKWKRESICRYHLLKQIKSKKSVSGRNR